MFWPERRTDMPPPLDLVLASTSPYRRTLLERLGLPFRGLAPDLDEDAFKGLGLSPRALAERLAEAKALSLRDREPEATLIGCDQLANLGGQVLGKPGNIASAIRQLEMMSGHVHELITALAVWHRGRLQTHTDITRLRMRRLSRAEIERYVQADLPLDCAGSYKLEQRGIVLFEEIRSSDHSAITGLPLIALTTILRKFGYAIP